MIAVVLVVCLAVAGYGVKHWSAAPSHPDTTPGVTAAAPAESAQPDGSLVTPAQANVILQKYWPVHEQALVSHDVAALKRLDTGAMTAYEVDAGECDCLSHKAIRPLLDSSLYVPLQTSYPVLFAVTAETTPYWTEVLVFTKSGADKPWLVSEDSGFEAPPGAPRVVGEPTVDTDGYALPPNMPEHQRALKAAGKLAQLWRQSKTDGAIPDQKTFNVSGQLQERLTMLAAHKASAVQANGLKGRYTFFVSPDDPLVEFAAGSEELACQALREKVVWSGPNPRVWVRQDPAQENWGKPIPPGLYRSVVSRDAWQTCFVIPGDPGEAIQVLDQEDGGGIVSLH